MHQTDQRAFEEKAKASAKQSLQREKLYETPERGSSIKFSEPNRAHRIFLENYCKSRGIAPPPLPKGAEGAARLTRARSTTQEDDALFQDAETHSSNKAANAQSEKNDE